MGINTRLVLAQGVTPITGGANPGAPPLLQRPPVPPSPTAAALGVYGNIPVGHFTGLPSVTIPIFELRSRELSTAISLSYHSTGLQVEQMASSTGLGWSLNAGGNISRTIFGMDDFSAFGYATNTYPLPPYGTEPRFGLPLGNPQRTAYDLANETFQNIYHHDLEPDLYNFSLNGRSGKFVFDQTGTPRVIPFQAITVEEWNPDHLSDTGYRLLDEQGVQYCFDAAESTRLVYDNFCAFDLYRDIGTAVSGYSLRWMISPSRQDTIYFQYEPDFSTYRNPTDQQIFNLLPGSTGGTPITALANPCGTTTKHAGFRLQSIRTATGQRAYFDYDPAERRDLKDNHRLQRVRIVDAAGQALRSYELYHGYFNGEFPATGPTTLQSAPTYRLRLDSVREVGKPAYRLSYVNKLSTLPSRESRSQDMYGYYNHSGETTLIPEMKFLNPLTGQTALYPGAIRAIDTVATQEAQLRSLRYPTGGQTVFDFEQHRLDPVITPLDSVVTVGAFSGSLACDTCNQNILPFGRFTFTTTRLEHVRVDYQFTVSNSPGTITGPRGGGMASGILRGQNTGYERRFYGPGGHNFDTVFLDLPADTYNLGVTATVYGDSAYAGGSVKLTRTGLKFKRQNQYVGGLRIRRIQDFSAAGKLASSREYFYLNPQTGLSSALVAPAPVFSYIYQTRYKKTIGMSPGFPTFEVVEDCHLARVPRSTIPQLVMQGGTVNYAAVTETFGTNKEGGKTEYFFAGQPDESSNSGYPFTPPISYEWARGNLQQENVYARQGSRYRLLKATQYTYTQLLDPANFLAGSPRLPHEALIPGAAIACIMPQQSSGYLIDIPGQYLMNWYYRISAWQYKNQTVETLYDPADSTRQLTTTTRYRYDNPDHLQLTGTVRTTSTGDSLWQRLRYPLDFAPLTGAVGPALAGLRTLQARHQLTPVVELREGRGTTAGRTLTGAQLTSYAASGYPDKAYRGQFTAPVLASQYPGATVVGQNLQLPAALALRTQVQARDEAGNVRQLSEDSRVSSYLWGQKQSVLIAQASSAPYAQIGYTSFENGEFNSWTGSRAGLTSSAAFTGRGSYQLGAGPLRLAAALPAGQYEVTLRLREGSGTVLLNGTALSPTATLSQGWRQYQLRQALSGILTLSGTGQVDELRLAPVGAQLTTYTHDPLVGMTSQTDPSGRTTTYEYDALGRLLRARDEQGRILSQQQYHYAKP